MLDHSSSFPQVAARQPSGCITAPKRRRSRVPGTFLGVDLGVVWDGSTRELVQALRHTGLERLFVLKSLSRGTQVIWRNDSDTVAFKPNDAIGQDPWVVRFDVTPEAGNRAEAHLPRLLESIASRMVWQQVEKRRDVPAVPMKDVGDWSNRSLSEPWKGDAA